jgi:hypothetical protein
MSRAFEHVSAEHSSPVGPTDWIDVCKQVAVGDRKPSLRSLQIRRELRIGVDIDRTSFFDDPDSRPQLGLSGSLDTCGQR